MAANELHPLAYGTLVAYGVSKQETDRIVENWTAPGRFYHGLSHLNHIVADIASRPEGTWNVTDRQLLVLAAVFHDVVYSITAADNEEASVAYARSVLGPRYIRDKELDRLEVIILATKDHTLPIEDPLAREFAMMDLYPLLELDLAGMVKYERGVFREYQRYPLKDYIAGRVQVLRRFADWMARQDKETRDIEWLIGYVQHRTYHVGVYAGSFDPFHEGHVDILLQAERQADKVIVAVGRNPAKTGTTADKNFEELRNYLGFRQTERFEGMLGDYVTSQHVEGANVVVTLFRGIRDGDDLSHETKQLTFMRETTDAVLRVAFLIGHKDFSHISSSAIRSLLAYNSVVGTKYLLYPYAVKQ